MVKEKSLIFSVDLEDYTGVYRTNGRFVSLTNQILDFLDQLSVSGTFFIVGKVAETCRSLVADVGRRGHEVACHSYDHTPVGKQSPAEFSMATQRAKHLLEDCVGGEVRGYRAPVFSLTEETDWAVEVLRDLGFVYSSSVLPAKNPLYGYPAAPKHPFRWSNGLLEFPCPVAKWGPLEIPFLGGIYLRYLPLSMIRNALQANHAQSLPWIYCHPYDFDHQERFSLVPGTPAWVSVMLWFKRKSTFPRLKNLFEGAATMQFGTFADRFEPSALPEYWPVSPPLHPDQPKAAPDHEPTEGRSTWKE